MNEMQLLKKLNETYLFNVTDTYRIQMTKAVIESDRINLKSEEFSEVRSAITRRQTNAIISKMISNPDIVFIKPQIPLPRALKVFTVKDIKTSGNMLKVFIDISEIIYEKDGQYSIASIDKLIAYLMSAMVQLIYNSEPSRIINNASMIICMRNAFSQMVTYIIDYLYKISNTDITKDMCKHLASMYFDINILKKDYMQFKDSINDSAMRISKLTNRQLDVLSIYVDENSFDNIKTFIETLAKVLKIQKLTLDVFLNKWIYLYGSGTQFALEFFPSLSDMYTNAYCLSYINNQKTIEKVIGNDLSGYAARMLSLGGGLL